jgi:DHA1 family multidrug resistance protein-like MFS transporter
MFDKLGVEWSLTLLGCFASVLAPVPIIFYFYGARIRQISKYNPQVVQGKPAQASTPEREGEV